MKRRGFLGMLFSAPAAAVVASKVKAAPAEKVEPVIEASSEWEPEGDDAWCATAAPLSRWFEDHLYRRWVK